jgi:hypothetical protein
MDGEGSRPGQTIPEPWAVFVCVSVSRRVYRNLDFVVSGLKPQQKRAVPVGLAPLPSL